MNPAWGRGGITPAPAAVMDLRLFRAMEPIQGGQFTILPADAGT